MLKMSKVLNVEMDIDELRNDDFRYEIFNIKFTQSSLGVIDGRFSVLGYL